ncbi:Blue-light photoreceptor PHR2 [Glycine soja]|nr:Blue-light photoreceptor PHR2 [Glycine soja]
MDLEAEKEHEAAFAVASLSLSLPTIFPFVQPKNIPSTTLQPTKLKVPTQASSLTHLSLSTTTPSPSDPPSPPIPSTPLSPSRPFQRCRPRLVSHDEAKAEEKVEAAMKEENVEVKYFWGSTLYHVDDLPFQLEDMPSNYGGFRDRVQKLEVRKTIEALDHLKGMPSRGDFELGEIPSLMDLGLNPSATMSQDGKFGANASMIGGETEALQRLKKFAAECAAQPNKGFKDGTQSIYGANFSCKISPWLAMGCLSPRTMYEELKKTTSRAISASADKNDGGNGSSRNGINWLMFELLWRDFFRFITKKYSSAKKQLEAAPVTACAGAYA